MDTMLTIDTGGDREVGTGYAEAVNGGGTPPRRQYPLELKRRVVEETFAPGASVSVVARRHDLNANLVFEWRKQYRQGRLWNGKPEPKASRPGPGPATSAGQALIRIGVIDHEGGVRPLPAADESCAPASPPSPPREPAVVENGIVGASVQIEIELPNGIKLRADAGIEAAALRRILATVSACPGCVPGDLA